MPNECGRKCSHCGCNGHDPRTCGGAAGFKLFGVQIGVPAEDAAESRIRKSKSLGNLQQACNAENSAGEASSGYLSDGLVHQSSKSHEGRRGKPWTEEEHRLFLAGLEKLGKGDWKGIAANFVQTRNSSQVASHAQKYFIRRATEKKRRRASIFDIPLSDSNRPSQQVIPGSADGSRPAAPLKNNGELKGRVIKARVAASERPPLSPMMKRRGVPDFRSMIYTSRPFPSQALSWAPKVNFSSQSSVHRPNIHGATFPTCAETFVPQPSDATSSIQQGSSQATINNDELNLNVRNLTL